MPRQTLQGTELEEVLFDFGETLIVTFLDDALLAIHITTNRIVSIACNRNAAVSI